MTPMAPDAAAITLTRTLRAPRDLVFEAWTNPRHVAQWFAPLGFTGRAELDVRPGGALYIAMIGPDGTEYPIHGRYVEVTPTTRLVYIEDVTHHPQAWHDTLRELMAKHGAHHAPSQCLVAATFEAQGPAVTRLTLTTRAESAGEIQAYLDMGMLEGWGHCLDKLDDLVTEGRSLKVERWISAPRALVYRAFTDPLHLAKWWGPNGFTTSTYHHDVRVGGEWRYHMHGPDGVDYPNKMVFSEVVPEQRLAYAHGELEGPAWFHSTITFSEHEGRTLVQLRSVFDSADGAEAARQYGAEEGGQQTLARWEAALTAPLEEPTTELVITRTLAAPRALVWAAFTQREHLLHWWGPAGLALQIKHFDLTPGGTMLYGMTPPGGETFWARWHFREVAAPHTIEVLGSFCDAEGRIGRHAMAPVWPLRMRLRFTFEDLGGQTRLTLTNSAFGGTAEEAAAFLAEHPGMQQGFGATFDQLDVWLAGARSPASDR